MSRYVTLRKQTVLPNASPDNNIRLYAKADETLETVDDEGNRVAVGAGGGGGAPDAHAASHESGGADEIDVTGLTGAGGGTPVLANARGQIGGGAQDASTFFQLSSPGFNAQVEQGILQSVDETAWVAPGDGVYLVMLPLDATAAADPGPCQMKAEITCSAADANIREWWVGTPNNLNGSWLMQVEASGLLRLHEGDTVSAMGELYTTNSVAVTFGQRSGQTFSIIRLSDAYPA